MNGGLALPAEVMIDDCETLWTLSTGLLRTVNATPTAGGSGYTAGDILDVTTGGAGGKVQVSTVDGGGAVTAIAHYAGGYGGYTTGTGKATSGGTGTGCTINITQVNNPAITTDAGIFHDGSKSLKFFPISSWPARSVIAYQTLGETLDLSAYSTLRFWLQSSFTITTGLLLMLCSDTAGRVVVDEFPVDTPITTNGTWYEQAHSRAGGGPLGAAIQSIALHRTSAPGSGSPTVYLDQIRVAP